jgi:hypothetical protein
MLSKKKNGKKKAPSLTAREKLSGKKKKSPLAAAKSSIKKKKKKTLRETEDDIRKKTKKKVVTVVDDDDDVDPDPDDVDLDSLESDDDEIENDEENDTESDDEEAEEEPEENEVDLSSVDPGPERSEVACGFVCGSCRKFVKIDDPIRQDPEWLSEQNNKKASSRCPFLFPDEVEIQENKKLSDFVMKADTKACDKFALEEEYASDSLQKSLGLMRGMNRGEIDVLYHSIENIRVLKQDEDKHGYNLGEKMHLLVVDSSGNNVRGLFEVVDFQRKKGAEVIVRCLDKIKGIGKRMSIPARRAVVIQ